MPSQPRPLPRTSRIRVRHESGAVKDVLRSQLKQLGPRWEVVRDGEQKKKRPPESVVETPAEPDEPASKEEE